MSDDSWNWGKRLKVIKRNKLINVKTNNDYAGQESNLQRVKNNAYKFYEIKLKSKKLRNNILIKKDVSDFIDIDDR